MLLILLFLLQQWSPTHANSEGSGIACLDATASLCALDCPNNTPRSWTTTTNGIQSPCCPPGMDLVHPPIYNTDYHVSIENAGTSISSLSYKPCELLTISLNVEKKEMKYLGLLIYFEDSAGEQVGEFVLPSENAIPGDTNGPKFHTCGDHNTAVMHVNANTKHYHHQFKYQAPKANTGTLTLRVLVKHGITNGGDFYWPGTYSIAGDETNTIAITQDVSLIENTTPATTVTSRWFISNLGETCDTTCERMGGGGGECDAAEMLAFAEKSTVEEQYAIASTLYACRTPMLTSNCTNGAIFNFDSEGSCYSTSSSCVNNAASLCSTTATEQGKICACKKSTNVNYAVACPSAIVSATTNSDIDSGGGGVSSPSPADTAGTAVIATLRNVQLDLDIEITLRNSEASIKLTGPSTKYFGIAFNTVTMDNSYSIIFEPNQHPHERTLGSHAAGTLLSTSFTYIDSYSVENGARRTQTVMRPITHQDNDLNYYSYYSFDNALKNGGEMNIILAVGESSSFKYHSPDNKAVATLDFGTGGSHSNSKSSGNNDSNDNSDINDSSKSNDSSKNGSANSKINGRTIGWIIGLVLFCLLVVAVASYLYFKKSNQKNRYKKNAPAVAIDVEMTNSSITTSNANPLDDFRSNHRVDHQVVEMIQNPSVPNLPLKRKPRKKRTTPTLPPATLSTICLFFLCFFSLKVVNGHNWIANPKSRIGGLGRTAPCPPRVGKSLHIAVRQGETFPIEWSDGHPGSFVYYTMVPREHENKLKELNSKIQEEYIQNAPQGTTSKETNGYLSDPFFDRIHSRFTTPDDQAVPGTYTGGGSHYSKILTSNDQLYFNRPDGWRCSRHHHMNCVKEAAASNEVLQQYQYVEQDLQKDIRVAYESEKYPWITAIFRVLISYKRPKDHSLGRFAFPEFAVPGEFVLQYSWRGYYDCFDIELLPGDSTKIIPIDPINPIAFIKETVWIKEEHTRFETFTGRSSWCFAVPSSGDLTQCLNKCRLTKKGLCNGVNIVPLYNPAMVKFPDNNGIPPSHNKCKIRVKNGVNTVNNVPTHEKSLICYGLMQPLMPEVGTPWIRSDDARDVTFYSTVLRKTVVQKVAGVTEVVADEKKSSFSGWRYNDQCISCEEANKKVDDITARWWEVVEQCVKC